MLKLQNDLLAAYKCVDENNTHFKTDKFQAYGYWSTNSLKYGYIEPGITAIPELESARDQMIHVGSDATFHVHVIRMKTVQPSSWMDS